MPRCWNWDPLLWRSNTSRSTGGWCFANVRAVLRRQQLHVFEPAWQFYVLRWRARQWRKRADRRRKRFLPRRFWRTADLWAQWNSFPDWCGLVGFWLRWRRSTRRLRRRFDCQRLGNELFRRWTSILQVQRRVQSRCWIQFYEFRFFHYFWIRRLDWTHVRNFSMSFF